MGSQTGFQQAFNVGELGPDGWSRSDLAQFSKGCVMGFNMIGRVVGPMGRRPGTWYCGAPKSHDAASRLIAFRKAVGDALVLEMGHLYARVWTVNGTLVLNAGVPVEFVTPWSAAQLDGLRWRQIGDVIYFTHRDGLRPQTLLRTSNTAWTIAPTVFVDGPWRPENDSDAHSLSLTGTLLNSDLPFFSPFHIGALFRLRAGAGHPGVLSWEPEEQNIPLNAQRLSDGRIYARVGAADDAGNTPPVHDRGIVSDGKVDWQFLTDGAGVVRCTAFNGDQQMQVEIVTPPPSQVSDGTKYWAEGAYSDYRGWPTANPAVREERLALAAAFSDPDLVNFTRTAGYTPTALDFKPGLGTGRVVDDDSVRRFVGDERNRLVWLEGSTFLMGGSTDGEFLITGVLDDPISPSGCVARPIGDYGSADIMPALAHKSVLFVAAGAEDLRMVGVTPDQGVSEADLSVVARHIGTRGFREITWLKQPWNLLWTRLGDGGAATLTWHAEQNVLGWNRQGVGADKTPTEDAPLGGGAVLESSCVVPGVNGKARLFMIVRRDRVDGPQRMILRLSDPAEKLFLDAAERYAGTAVSGVGGLNHLTGDTVTMMAATVAGAAAVPGRGWGQYEDRTVGEDGEALLPTGTTATAMYVGLPFLSRWEGMPPEFSGPGSSAGRLVSYKHATVVMEAGVAEAGTVGDEGDSATDRFVCRDHGDTAGPVTRRRSWRTTLLGGASRERRLFVQTRSGFDLVIHSIRATADVES